MHFPDLAFGRGRQGRSAILEEAYRLRAARLRAEAIEPVNLRRRSLLFYAACEYELLADNLAEAAHVERFRADAARAADRRRRTRKEARTHGGRML
jgi:hypothetical protein